MIGQLREIFLIDPFNLHVDIYPTQNAAFIINS